jgi:hypothetical protein
LKSDPQTILREIFEFSLSQESLQGSFIESRIKDAIKTASSNTHYIPRKGTINGNAHLFSTQ